MSWLIKKITRKGMVLILTFIIITTLTAIVAAFLYLTSNQLKGSGYDVASHKALWLAEAGIQKAIYYLEDGNALLGTNGTTGGITESLGNGSYNIVVSLTGVTGERLITSTGTWPLGGVIQRIIKRTAVVYDTATEPYYQSGYGVGLLENWEEE